MTQGNEISNLWIAPKGEDKSARQITKGLSDGDSGLTWTGDGKLIYTSNATGPYQLWTTDAQGGAPRQLTTEALFHSFPTFCHGLDRIFYIADASGSNQLWSADLQNAQVRQETNSDQQFFAPDCSPDGTWFVGLTFPKRSSVADFSPGRLTRIERASGQRQALFEDAAIAPAISPDGKRIAFLYGPGMAPEDSFTAPRIGILPAVGGTLEKSFALPSSARALIRWTPDGRSVAYVDRQGSTENIWLQPVKGDKPKQLTHFSEGLIFNFAWSRDGKSLALARGSQPTDAVMFTSVR